MLKGHLIELRPVARHDLEHLYRWANDEQLADLGHGSSSAYQNNNPKEDIEAFYDKNLTQQALWDKGRVFIVYTIGTSVPIGKCDYRALNPVTRTAEVGISIGERAYWGQGYGSDVLSTLLKHLFNTLNLERVQMDTWSGNTQALRLYEKAGFVEEGRLRKNEFVQGSYYDTVLLGMLRSEFEA